ncbi:MAG: hypothetical protein HY602_02030, partial [Parcubacteria group bacterium]|nr:hypothetical protein [Parcubacteria group bacterium]
MARKTSALAVIFLWFIALPASAQEADMAEYPKIPVASSSEQSRRLLGQELSPSLMEKLEHGKTLRQNMALRSLRGILGDSGSKAAVNNI